MNDDLFKALSAFLICFGQELPAQVKDKINQRCKNLAADIVYNGEPNVGKLLECLGDALVTEIPKRPNH